jgi:hypothetical protein
MNRWFQILSISFMLTLASVVSAQVPAPCGIVGIDGPDTVEPGTPVVLKAKAGNSSKPEFKWSVSAGTIIQGQDTDEITIDTAGLAGATLTVTVELIGAPLACIASASTRVVIPPFQCGMAFDEYGDLKFEDEKSRLDNFSIPLSNDPHSRGLILMSAGQKTFTGEAAYRLDRAKSYLMKVRGIDSSRIVTKDCGFNHDLTTTLRIVPDGATIPECDTFRQLPLSEVKFTKPRPKSSKKRR